MRKIDDFQSDQTLKRSPISRGLDPLIILSILRKNWYWFVIGIGLGVYGSRLYIRHTLPVYETSATLLVNENENRQIVDNTELLQGLGLPGGMQNIENQMMILQSRDLTESTLNELPFEVEFYFKTFRNRLPVYPESPLRVYENGKNVLPRNTEFIISSIGNNKFILECGSEYFPLNRTASFGDSIAVQNGSFRIECRNEQWLIDNMNRKLCFMIYSSVSLVNNYSNRVNVSLMSRGGSILKISLSGTNPAKDADFINKHLEGFRARSLGSKNSEADRRIQFIDAQLIGISDSLSITENRLQQFRSANRVMDLSAQGQSIIGQVTLLENERARLNLEANYYDYLADYLAKESAGQLIVPITMGISDPGLTRLVEELTEYQGQLAARGAGEMNPLQRNLEQRVRTIKEGLNETLNGLRRANNLAREENRDQINRANAQASALPATERQLLGIERKFKLNDELFTFLLETRAEQLMQKASNRADSEIVDRADKRFSYVISPVRSKIKFAGLLAGMGIPFLIIFLWNLLKNKVEYEDIQHLTSYPVVGNIPRNNEKISTVVFDSPNSTIAEAYRLLRSRMQFFTKESTSPVILITSSMPAEGKTFTAVNLASAYSLLGKKTILLGFDLRIPKIYQDFNLHNNSGISTWLIGKDKLDNVIQKTNYENLWVIPAGPVPPNPSELIALEKTKDLLESLKERFDFIIIDSSPIGFVSDTFHLASLSDACLIVVRPGFSIKDLLVTTFNEVSSNGIKGVSLVINDVKSGKHHGYGERYGYTKNEKSKKLSLKKMKMT
jgi:tyrosine-protein kinase Etk/Wzc